VRKEEKDVRFWIVGDFSFLEFYLNIGSFDCGYEVIDYLDYLFSI
jgi:hypothetical protein